MSPFGNLIKSVLKRLAPRLFSNLETPKITNLKVADRNPLIKSAADSVRTLLNSTSNFIDNAHDLLNQIDTDPFTNNMRLVRQYFDHRAENNSKILGSSNPLMPMAPLVRKAIVSASESKRDPYTMTAEKHQREGNSWRYYGSRSSQGITELRRAMYEYCEDQGFNTEQIDFMVTHSIPGSLLPAVCEGALEKGDQILLTTPSFGPFYTLLDDYRFNLTPTRLNADTDWKMTPEILEKILAESPNARMFVFINPGNPMGETYSKQELEALSEVFIRHNQNRPPEKQLLVFSDEVAKNCILDEDKTFTSIGSIPGMEDFTITAWSLSKDQSPGLGIAIGIIPRNMIEQIRKGEGPAFASQYAAAEVFKRENQEEMSKYYEDSVVIYRHHFKLAQQYVQQLNQSLNTILDTREVPFISHEPHIPDGGFQFVFSTKGLLGFKFPEGYVHTPNPGQREIKNSLDLAWYLRSTCKVELVPGEGFGFDGDEMKFRVTISKREGILKEAFEGINKGISKLIPSIEVTNNLEVSEIKVGFIDTTHDFSREPSSPRNIVKQPSAKDLHTSRSFLLDR